MQRGHLILIGASYRTAPLAVRERLAINDDAAPEALRYLKEYASESLVLSTCNRTEIYLVGHDAEQTLYGAMNLFSTRGGRSFQRQELGLYVLTDDSAARHLMDVASGVDSLIPGEHEILSQVRRASRLAREAGSLGPVLSRLCQMALHAGKRARTETAIGQHPASVSLASVRLAQEVCGPLQGRAALVIGAGQTASLTAQALQSCRIGAIHAANRTLAKAQELAQRVGGQAWGLDAVEALLPQVDLVISCTSAPDLVLTVEQIAAAQMERDGRPLLLIDLALPRDIDPQARELRHVALYDLEDLESICERNQAARRRALADVEAIVRQESEAFMDWWESQETIRTVARLRVWAEALRQGELEKSLRKLAHLSPQERQAIGALTEALVHKLLHAPTVYLKSSDPREAERTAWEVFGLRPPLSDQIHSLLEYKSEKISHG
ncbi:MAG: glutamyl-tRNA reductase [Chloroflexi bacterium]|nr:glutamyl-tRNA reductase [Chloroflexota bacterium]